MLEISVKELSLSCTVSVRIINTGKQGIQMQGRDDRGWKLEPSLNEPTLSKSLKFNCPSPNLNLLHYASLSACMYVSPM
jgi:hypothetical protein